MTKFSLLMKGLNLFRYVTDMLHNGRYLVVELSARHYNK